jgi:hypothetical protein
MLIVPPKIIRILPNAICFDNFEDMKRKLNSVLYLAALVYILSLSSCTVFKKKCDCPTFGKSKRHAKITQTAAEVI